MRTNHPWNYPFMMAAWKVAPALAAGCTVVLKPASFTPITAYVLAEVCHEAGVPEGVVNVLTGSGSEIGPYMTEHPGIDKIAFTGETETGKDIMARASVTLKRVTLELGGKSPNIVFEDCDMDGAVDGSLYGIFFTIQVNPVKPVPGCSFMNPFMTSSWRSSLKRQRKSASVTRLPKACIWVRLSPQAMRRSLTAM